MDKSPPPICADCACTQPLDDAGDGHEEPPLGEGAKAALRTIHSLSQGDGAGLDIPPGSAVCLGLAGMGDEAAEQLAQMLGRHRGNREAVRALLAVHLRHLGLGDGAVAGADGSSGQGASGSGAAAAEAGAPVSARAISHTFVCCIIFPLHACVIHDWPRCVTGLG